MADINKLTVFAEARELVRTVIPLTENLACGDLGNQLKRAIISVVSNIAEGGGSGSDRQFGRYLKLARSSVNEAQAQLAILADIGLLDAGHPAHNLADRIGRRLTCLIRSLNSG